jgi:Asp/Glu/hydantoin racemase
VRTCESNASPTGRSGIPPAEREQSPSVTAQAGRWSQSGGTTIMFDAPLIILLHATSVAIQPVEDAFARLWPEASATSLLDEGLTVERSKTHELTEPLIRRFVRLVDYADSTEPDGILITCSAFGPAIDEAIAHTRTPIVKPNEAMFETALSSGLRTGMVATFAPSVPTMAEEYEALAAIQRPGATLRTVLAAGAMEALRAGDGETHDDLVAEAAAELADCDTVLLAHFSTARAAGKTAIQCNRQVLTAPDSAVTVLRRRYETYSVKS